MLFSPYTNVMVTSHMVPEISNIPEAFDNPSIYQGSLFSPSRYEDLFFWARFFKMNPIEIIEMM